MRTKFIATLAAATLLTVASTAAALAQAGDVIAATNQDVISDVYQNTSATQNSAPDVGFSAHHHPHGHRYP